MKVVAHLPLYPPHSLVGAWITTHEFLRHLVTEGHQVDVVTFLTDQPGYELDGVTVHPRRTALDADVIVCHAGDKGHAARIAGNTPRVTFVHGKAKPIGLAGSRLVVFNSESTRADTPWTGRSVICHPPVDPSTYATKPGKNVTLVNLSDAKGGYLFWTIARRLPHLPFLGVRGSYGQQVVRRSENTEVVPTTTDMREVYSRTRILLMPSVRESWGRVALEAAASGIPTISTPTDGVTEAMGDAASYVERRDIGGWIAAIERLHDPVEWKKASRAALQRSKIHDPKTALSTFSEAFAAVAPVPA